MKIFEVINPVIAGDGTIQTKFTENSAEVAAKKFWDSLTSNKLIAKELREFLFSLKSDNDLYHFRVKELKDKDGEITYTIERIEIENNNDEKDLIQEAQKITDNIKGVVHKGGKKKRKHRKDTSSSSSESSSDEEKKDTFWDDLRKEALKSRLAYWWYAPLIYKVKRIFTPVFYKAAPYVQLWLPSRM